MSLLFWYYLTHGKSTHVCTDIAYLRRLKIKFRPHGDYPVVKIPGVPVTLSLVNGEVDGVSVNRLRNGIKIASYNELTICVACSPSNFCNFCNCWTRDPLLSSRLTIFFLYSQFSETRISTFLSNESIYSFFLRRLSCADICIW